MSEYVIHPYHLNKQDDQHDHSHLRHHYYDQNGTEEMMMMMMMKSIGI